MTIYITADFFLFSENIIKLTWLDLTLVLSIDLTLMRNDNKWTKIHVWTKYIWEIIYILFEHNSIS
jgi:hypothetical protein